MTGEPNVLRVMFVSTCLDETRDFYENALRLPVVESFDNPGDRGVAFQVGSALIGVFDVSDLHPFEPPRGFCMSLEVSDVDASFRRLVQTGVADREKPPRDRPWGLRAFPLTDPNGIEVIVYSPIADLDPA